MKALMLNTEMRKAYLRGNKTQTRRLVKPKFRSGEIGYHILRNAHTNVFDHAEYFDELEDMTRYMPQPYNVGDVLYIPEPWKAVQSTREHGYEVMFQDGQMVAFQFETTERAEQWYKYLFKPEHQWQSPYFMPREAARHFATVTAVDIQQLQDISDEDILAEGVLSHLHYPMSPVFCPSCHGEGTALAVGPNGGAVEVDCQSCNTLEKRFRNLWNSTVPKEKLPLYGYEANPDVWAIRFAKITKKQAERLEGKRG